MRPRDNRPLCTLCYEGILATISEAGKRRSLEGMLVVGIAWKYSEQYFGPRASSRLGRLARRCEPTIAITEGRGGGRTTALARPNGRRASDRWLVADRRSMVAWLLPPRVDADLPEKTQAV
jgi:hypothetical protein